MSKSTPESMRALLQYLAGGPEHKHQRLVIEHEIWCPLLKGKGPCACNSVTHEATDEEWKRLTSEKPEQDKQHDLTTLTDG